MAKYKASRGSAMAERSSHYPRVKGSNLASLLAPRGLYYKTFSLLIYDKMDRFHSTQVPLQLSVTFIGLNKHTGLIRNLYITNL